MKNLLIYRPTKHVFYWNPKCGCSTIREWYLRINNIPVDLSDSEDLYRLARQPHIRGFNNEETKDYKHIIISRNPFSRVVSSYCMLYYNQTPLGLIIAKKDYTFTEYVKMLKEYYDHDIHTDLQCKDIENIKFDQVIDLDHFDKEIKVLCDEIKVPYPLSKKQGLNAIERDINHYYTTDIWDIKLSEFTENKDNKNIIWKDTRVIGPPIVPHYKKFYNEELRQQIVDIYKKDFNFFDYSYNL